MSVIFKKFEETVELKGPFKDILELQDAAITALRIMKTTDTENYYLEFVDGNEPVPLTSDEAFKIFDALVAKQNVTVNIWPNSMKKIDHCGSFVFQVDGTKSPHPHISSQNTLVLDSLSSIPSKVMDETPSSQLLPEDKKIDEIFSTSPKKSQKVDPPKEEEKSTNVETKATEEDDNASELKFKSVPMHEVKSVNSSDIQAKLNMFKKLSAANATKKTASTPQALVPLDKPGEDFMANIKEIVHQPEIKKTEEEQPKSSTDDALNDNNSPSKGLINKVQAPSKLNKDAVKAKLEAAKQKKQVDPIQINVPEVIKEARNEVITPVPTTEPGESSATKESFAPIQKTIVKTADSDAIARIKAKQIALKESATTKASPLITPKKLPTQAHPVIAGMFAPHSNSPKTSTLSPLQGPNTRQMQSSVISHGSSQPPDTDKSSQTGQNSTQSDITSTGDFNQSQAKQNNQPVQSNTQIAEPSLANIDNPPVVDTKNTQENKIEPQVEQQPQQNQPQPQQTSIMKKSSSVRFAESPKQSPKGDISRSSLSSINSSQYYNDYYFKTLKKEKSLRVNTEEAHDRLNRYHYFEEKGPLRIPDSNDAIPEYPDDKTESPKTLDTSQRMDHQSNYNSLNRIGSNDNNSGRGDLSVTIPRENLKNLMMEIFFENMGFMTEQIKERMNGSNPNLGAPMPSLKRNTSTNSQTNNQAPNVQAQALEYCQQLSDRLNSLNPEQRKLANSLLAGIPEKIAGLFSVQKFGEDSWSKNQMQDMSLPVLGKRSSSRPPADNPDFGYKIDEKPCPKATTDVVEFQKTILITNTGPAMFPEELVIRPRNPVHGVAKKVKSLEPGKSIAVVLGIQLPRKAGDFESEWEFASQNTKISQPIIFKIPIEES